MTAPQPAPPPAPHGTVKRYAQDCRCEPCSEAAAPYQEAWEAASEYTLEHGTPAGFRYGCTCEPCRTAYQLQRHRSDQKRTKRSA